MNRGPRIPVKRDAVVVHIDEKGHSYTDLPSAEIERRIEANYQRIQRRRLETRDTVIDEWPAQRNDPMLRGLRAMTGSWGWVRG